LQAFAWIYVYTFGMAFLDKISHTFLSFIFPSQCLSCKKTGSSLCPNCLDKIPQTPQTFYASNQEINHLYSFRQPIFHQAMWLAKYHHNTEILQIFGKKLGEFILQRERLSESSKNIFVIPIPLSKKDLRLHNHAHTLAKATGFTVCDVLEKDTHEKQARLQHRSERSENVKGKIYVSEKKLKAFLNKWNLDIHDLQDSKKCNFILIDDVVTTGSTLLEAEKVLENVGIKISKIYTLTH
jgi:competence protein ComFC